MIEPGGQRGASGHPRPSFGRLVSCWAVHVYTASGAVLALAALVETTRNEVAAAFACLWLAVVVDATDGTLARAARVKEVLPHVDGEKLDDIVDYLTFVLVPIFMLLETKLLAGPMGAVVAAGAVIASACRFCRDDAKTSDHFFTGFPSYWNVLALYLYLYEPPPGICALITALLAALVLSPLRFIYPSRMERLRRVSVGFGVGWAALVALIVYRLPERSTLLATVSLAYPAYYAAASFYLDWQTRLTSTHRTPTAGRSHGLG